MKHRIRFAAVSVLLGVAGVAQAGDIALRTVGVRRIWHWPVGGLR